MRECKFKVPLNTMDSADLIVWGSYINYVDRNLRIFDPIPPSLTRLLNTRSSAYKKRSKKWYSLGFVILYSRFLFF